MTYIKVETSKSNEDPHNNIQQYKVISLLLSITETVNYNGNTHTKEISKFVLLIKKLNMKRICPNNLNNSLH
jgi:hypothetical protein